LDSGPISVVNNEAKGSGDEAQLRSPAASPAGGPLARGLGHGVSEGPPCFFRTAMRGQSVVYVIDRSLSMGLSGALGAAKREVIRSIETLPDTMRFQVIFYNRRAEPLHFEDAAEL